MPSTRAARPRRVEREEVALCLANGAEVRLLRVRDPRARRLRLSVDARGARLTVPCSASLREAEAFVAEHGAWLLRELADCAAAASAVSFARGWDRPLPLRGTTVPVRWREGRFARAGLERGAVVVELPGRAGDAAARRLLHEFYLAEARADVGRWLPRYLPDLPAAPGAIRIRPLVSLWGSLSSGNAVSLDLSLVLAPPAAFEYVLVHELCHLVRRDHSPAFWREVEARCPGWRRQRAWFRDHGSALKAILAGLLGRDRGA